MWAAIGVILAAVIAAWSQQEANQQNKKEAQKNRAFQERMSNTAHQRAMADLRSGGLNPILGGTSAASTPSGSMATMQKLFSGTEANSAITALRDKQQIANLKATEGLTDAQKKVATNTAKLTGFQSRIEELKLDALEYGINTAKKHGKGFDLDNWIIELFSSNAKQQSSGKGAGATGGGGW